MRFIKKYKFGLLIIFLFVLSRWPDLGHDMFNTDVWKWKARTFDFGTGVFTLDLDKTVQKYHPGVTLMWTGTIAVKFFNFYKDLVLAKNGYTELQEVFALHAFQKFFVVLAIGTVLAFIFYPLKKLFGNKYAFLSVLLIALEPFNIALTRVFHLEGLMSIFMVASFVWYYYFLYSVTEDDYQKGIRLYYKKALYISAAFGALAVLTKTSALVLLPMIFLMDLQANKFKFYLDNIFLWAGVFVISLAVFWPVIITNPALVFATLYKGIFEVGIVGEHFQLFNGKWVEDPGLMFYPVVFLYRSSLYLFFGLIGYLFMITRKSFEKSRSRMYKFSFHALVFALFYIVVISLPTKKLDRYILPAMLLLVFPVAEYINNLIHGTKNKVIIKSVVLAIPLAFTVFYLHPNYFSYYSPLFGGLKKGIFVLEPKWMFGQRELQRSLQLQQQADGLQKFEKGESLDEFVSNEAVKQKFTVGFLEKYYTQMWPFVEEIGGKATILDIAAHAKSSNYFVFPVWDDKAYLENRVKLEYTASVMVRGVETYKIYRVLH